MNVAADQIYNVSPTQFFNFDMFSTQKGMFLKEQIPKFQASMGIDKSFNLKGKILPDWFTRYFPGQNIAGLIKGLQSDANPPSADGEGDYEKSLRSIFNLDPSQVFSLEKLRPNLTAQDAHLAKGFIAKAMEWGALDSQNLPVPGDEIDMTKARGTNLVLNQAKIGNIYQPGGQPQQFEDFNQRFQKSLALTAPFTNWNQGMWLHSIAIGRNMIYGDDEVNPMHARAFNSVLSAKLAHQPSSKYISKEKLMNSITHQIKTQISVPLQHKFKNKFANPAHAFTRKYMKSLQRIQSLKKGY